MGFGFILYRFNCKEGYLIGGVKRSIGRRRNGKVVDTVAQAPA